MSPPVGTHERGSDTEDAALEDAAPPGGRSSGSSSPVVLVVDFGAQYAQLIARRVRQARVYSEIVPHSAPLSQIVERHPAALILSGGPASVYCEDAPSIDPALFDLGVPILGICYGFQVMAQALGGRVERTKVAEFGPTRASVHSGSRLLNGAAREESVWMSHRDAVLELPDDFTVTASTAATSVAAFENEASTLCGVQWHPEVSHSPRGQELIETFLYRCAGIAPTWTPTSIIDETVKSVADLVGKRHVLCALSGGVDSAVAAALVQRAVGDQLTCVFVDHGFLREGEAQQVERDFVTATGARLISVPAQRKFLEALDALENPEDPEEKRRTIGRVFIEVFEETADRIIREQGHHDDIEFLVQGTLYPDVVESGGGEGAATIKTHHNVGGLPDDLTFELIEPLRRLFKDEVRAVGIELGLPADLVWRQPFPGPGLAIRIIGRVTKERLSILRRADAIVREELSAHGLDRTIWQCPVILLADVRSVGVQGDQRTYGHPILLRPVSSEDAMTADFSRLPYDLISKLSARITNEVPQVNRVVLDVTPKPPGTIEWE